MHVYKYISVQACQLNVQDSQLVIKGTGFTSPIFLYTVLVYRSIDLYQILRRVAHIDSISIESVLPDIIFTAVLVAR